MSYLRKTLTVLAATAFLTACDDDPVQVDPELTLTVAPAALTVQQGATGESDITAVRDDSDDAITLSVTGGGTGVTADIEDEATNGDEKTATLMVSVSEGAVPGAYTFTVTADIDDADDVTRTVTVTVTEFVEEGQN